MGEGDGLTWTEFASRYPSPDWDLDPSAVSAPGSESLLAFYERALQSLSDIVRQHPRQRVLVVCHGGVIEQAMKKSLGRPARERLRLRTEHCSMTEFEVRSEGWRLLRYNDAAPVAR
jgi:probable phosphoglycerate mutase